MSVDLAFLPEPVRSQARLVTRGAEVMWHRDTVADAIEALAAAGRIVIGLDARSDGHACAATEVAWSVFEPTGHDDCEAARAAARDALERLDGDATTAEYEWVLVTWAE